MKVSKDRKNECREWLLSLLNPGDTVYGVVRSVSRSGMSRRIDFYSIKGGELQWLTPFVGDLCGYSHSCEKDGLRVDGCGMDMIFKVVYDLGSALWPNGTPKPHGRRNGEPDSHGGYALKHGQI